MTSEPQPTRSCDQLRTRKGADLRAPHEVRHQLGDGPALVLVCGLDADRERVDPVRRRGMSGPRQLCGGLSPASAAGEGGLGERHQADRSLGSRPSSPTPHAPRRRRYGSIRRFRRARRESLASSAARWLVCAAVGRAQRDHDGVDGTSVVRRLGELRCRRFEALRNVGRRPAVVRRRPHADTLDPWAASASPSAAPHAGSSVTTTQVPAPEASPVSGAGASKTPGKRGLLPPLVAWAASAVTNAFGTTAASAWGRELTSRLRQTSSRRGGAISASSEPPGEDHLTLAPRELLAGQVRTDRPEVLRRGHGPEAEAPGPGVSPLATGPRRRVTAGGSAAVTIRVAAIGERALTVTPCGVVRPICQVSAATAALGAAVRPGVRRSPSRPGGDPEDPAVTGRCHDGECRAEDVEVAVQMDREHGGPVLLAAGCEVGRAGDAGHVHHRVECPELLDQLREEGSTASRSVTEVFEARAAPPASTICLCRVRSNACGLARAVHRDHRVQRDHVGPGCGRALRRSPRRSPPLRRSRRPRAGGLRYRPALFLLIRPTVSAPVGVSGLIDLQSGEVALLAPLGQQS